MQTRLSVVAALSAVSLFVGAAGATIITNPNDPRSFQGASVGTFAQLYFGADNLANRQQVVDQQLLDDGVFNPVGYNPGVLLSTPWSNGFVSTGFSHDLTGVGGYDYTTPGASPFVAAGAIDNQWIQSSGRIGDTVFDFGGPVINAAVFPVIDHGPLPLEAIESTVYLSNDLVNWTQARVLRVFLEGFSPNLGIQWDGFSYVVGTGTSDTFRYASIIHGGPGGLLSDGDDEINGVLGFNDVPAPGAAGLLSLGLLAAGRRKR